MCGRSWPLCRAQHNAESLLTGGRGAPTLINEALPSRGRQSKDPVALNRRSDGGGLWGLNAADAASRRRRQGTMVRQLGWRVGRDRHAAARGSASREMVGFRSRAPMLMNAILRRSSNAPPPLRRRACEAGVLGLLAGIHGATHGGPRGSVPGRNDSMRTIGPLPHCGQSRSDLPVRRWY